MSQSVFTVAVIESAVGRREILHNFEGTFFGGGVSFSFMFSPREGELGTWLLKGGWREIEGAEGDLVSV